MSYENTLSHARVAVPSGMTAYQFVGAACITRTPDCQKSTNAIKDGAVSAVRADAHGFPVHVDGCLPGLTHRRVVQRLLPLLERR